MVRDDEERRLVVDFGQYLRQRAVHRAVEVLDGPLDLGRRVGLVQRMLGVHRPPHHMGVLVDAGEVEVEEAVVKVGQRFLETGEAFTQHDFGLCEVLLLLEDAVREGLRIFGEPLGVVPARASGDLRRVAARRAYGQRRLEGVDVDGGDVEPEMGPHLF